MAFPALPADYPQECGINGRMARTTSPIWNAMYGYWVCTCDKDEVMVSGYRRRSHHVCVLHPTFGWVWSTSLFKICKTWRDAESAAAILPLPAPDAPDEDGTEPLPLQDQDASEAPASALSAPTEPSPAHTLPEKSAVVATGAIHQTGVEYHQKWDLAGIDQNSPVSTGVAASQVKNIEQGLS
mmetsp:Transcript_24650/g.53703  ORF Transcript_24650/g.53703 Transcript_24650/m.53703 type:complete len:183 (+) Transcript_24650:47-595(+)